MSKELETRNRAMYTLYVKGVSIQQIADRYEVSRQRVSQVITRYASDGALTDDDSRTLHRVQLESIKDELAAMFYEPPPVTFDVKGNMLIDENGEPVRDIKLKLETAKMFVNVSESLRKMDATDKPRRKQLPQDEAMRQMEEYLSSLPRAEVTHDEITD